MPALRALAFLLLVAGAALPARGLAVFLVGAEDALLAQVAQGAWALKGALIGTGLALLACLRWGSVRAGGDPLLTTTGLESIGTGRRAPARSELGLVAALVAVALALRLFALGRGLWFDEIDTLVHYVRLPLRRLVALYDSRNNHLLYSVLANGSTRVFGEGAAALRLPAALFGAASVWALWSFGRRVTRASEALLGAAVLAFSYHHLSFSQNARGYTGMLFFALLGSALFVDLLQRRRAGGAGPALGYGACMALAAAMHPMAVMAAAAHGLVWLGLLWTERGRALGRRRWLAAWGFLFAALLGLLLYALVLPQFFGLITDPPGMSVKTEWQDVGWMVRETLAGLARGLPGGWLAVGAAAAVGLVGVASYARQSAVVLALMLLGTALTLGAVQVLNLNLWPRYFFLFAGFFVLIACRGLFAAAPSARGVRLGLAVCVVAACAFVAPRGWAPKQDYTGALEYVRSERRPGDAVATADMAAFVLNDYLGAGFARVEELEALRDLEASHERTWFVHTFPTRFSAELPALWEHVQREYTVERTFYGSINGGEVVVSLRGAP